MFDLDSMASRTVRATLSPPVVVGLLLAFFGSFLLRGAMEVALTDPGPVVEESLSVLGMWVLAGGLLALVLWWERRSLASIGLTVPSGRDVLWGVAGFVVGALTFAITTPLIGALGLEDTGSGIQTLAQLPLWLVVLVAITAGVTEEILYRGYPIERLAELTGSIWTGAVLTFVVFAAAHVPFWGVGGAIQVGVWTVVVTALYVWRRNLVACVVMHVLNDLYAFVLLPIVFY